MAEISKVVPKAAVVLKKLNLNEMISLAENVDKHPTKDSWWWSVEETGRLDNKHVYKGKLGDFIIIIERTAGTDNSYEHPYNFDIRVISIKSQLELGHKFIRLRDYYGGGNYSPQAYFKAEIEQDKRSLKIYGKFDKLCADLNFVDNSHHPVLIDELEAARALLRNK